MKNNRKRIQKGISVNNNDLSPEFKNKVEKFEKYYNDPEQFNKIFTKDEKNAKREKRTVLIK